jgi:hypothetical protein
VREDNFLGVFKLNKEVVDLDEIEIHGDSKTEALDRDVQVITETLKKDATAAKDVLNKISGITYDDYSGTLKVDSDPNIMVLVNGVEKSQEYVQNLDPERLSDRYKLTDPRLEKFKMLREKRK